MDYAISDIHGCNKTFLALLEKIAFSKNDNLFLLGDYIDRGPDSKGVIDTIFRLQNEGYNVRTLMGNHEQMMYNAYTALMWEEIDMWTSNGGKATLQSFGVTKVNDIPEKYISFIENLEMYIELPKYYLVHAGFDFSQNTIFDSKESMLWIRRWYADIVPEMLHGKKVIHGHTPMPLKQIQQNVVAPYYPALDIDGGCFAEREGYGYLCAFNLTEEKLIWKARTDY